MPNWKPGTPLQPDQTPHPVCWHSTLAELGYGRLISLPALTPEWFDAFWGDGQTSRRLKSFGHKEPKDRASPHFLCSRGGLAMHTDPGYTRYSLQVQLYNPGGFAVLGLEDELAQMPLYEPGLVMLLDTWSPHSVVRDRRLPQSGKSGSKLLAAADYADRPDWRRELPKLVEHIPLLPLEF
jgi:hypothetical protein